MTELVQMKGKEMENLHDIIEINCARQAQKSDERKKFVIRVKIKHLIRFAKLVQRQQFFRDYVNFEQIRFHLDELG